MGWELVENEDGTKVWTEIVEEEGDEMDEDVPKKEDVVLQQMCMTDQSTIHVCSGPSGKTEVNILNTLHFILLWFMDLNCLSQILHSHFDR